MTNAFRPNGEATYRVRMTVGRADAGRELDRTVTAPARITDRRVKTSMYMFDRETGRELSRHYVGRGHITLQGWHREGEPMRLLPAKG